MSEKRNIFGQVYDFFDELNQQQREMDVRDAARNRGPDGGRTEAGLPRISLPEWLSGLREEDALDIQRQGSANTLGELNGKKRTANPEVFSEYRPDQGEKEDDLTFQSRVKGEMDGLLEVNEAIESGVPKSTFYNDDNELTTMDAPKVRQLTEKYRERAKLIEQIEKMELGPEYLRDHREQNGGKLNYDQLLEVRSKANKDDPATIRAGELHADTLKNSQSTRDVNEGTLQLNRDKVTAETRLADERLNLDRTKETNDNRLSQWEMDYKTAVANQQFRNEQLRLQYENERAAADLDLRRDLAVLGLEGQAEDRRYESERDRAQDKQMFILQLMKGLGSLGQGFAL